MRGRWAYRKAYSPTLRAYFSREERDFGQEVDAQVEAEDAALEASVAFLHGQPEALEAGRLLLAELEGAKASIRAVTETYKNEREKLAAQADELLALVTGIFAQLQQQAGHGHGRRPRGHGHH
ncbi:hypothetical protein [Streptomyces sp. NRRL S-350]|uniref:hypothetical protein n=1 Tax=Streptomyces sp. NRRL S-350 TaxID=1463902 RepID=UPI0004BF1662|nr:hypothetical protein [Streptomyces sp. NRRL S-350]